MEEIERGNRRIVELIGLIAMRHVSRMAGQRV